MLFHVVERMTSGSSGKDIFGAQNRKINLSGTFRAPMSFSLNILCIQSLIDKVMRVSGAFRARLSNKLLILDGIFLQIP